MADVSKSLCVFCGAGFSAAAGIPLMTGFARAIREQEFLTPQELADFENIQAYCGSMSAVLGASPANVEQLYSFLATLEYCQPGMHFPSCEVLRTPRQAMDLLVKAIAFAFGHPTLKPELAWKSAACLKHLLGAPKGPLDLHFITTNYDMHIEMALRMLDIRPISPLKGIAPPCHEHASYECIYDPQSVHSDKACDSFRTALTAGVYKLHGSVNWLLRENRVELEDRWSIDRWMDDDVGRGWQLFGFLPSAYRTPREQPKETWSADWCRRSQFGIVPPTVVKRLLPGQSDPLSLMLQQQWSAAHAALQAADYIWFIGYSFPETDNLVRFLLGAALSRNVRVQQIAVIDPSWDVIELRARPLFSTPQLRDSFISVPDRWPLQNASALLYANDVATATGKRSVHFEEQRYLQNLKNGALFQRDRAR